MPYLEHAINLMDRALEYDENKDYGEALKMYESGIELFLDALHMEVEGELAREAVVSKCQDYCARAEELRQRINEKAGHPSPPTEMPELQERHLPKAIEILTRARQEDAKSNVLEALRLYEKGIYHFDIVLGYEIYSHTFKAALESRQKIYKERMNILRERLNVN